MLNKKHMKLCQQIVDAGGRPYVVGGFVRDSILGRNPKDIDIVVIGLDDPQLHAALCGPMLVGKSFSVCLKEGIEFALARTERKTGLGHTDFECSFENVTLEEDLARRDLTINAMAMDPFTGDLIDPYGGVRDIRNGVLRAVGPCFKEDSLRILRAARFAAQLGMNVTRDLIASAEPALGELTFLSGERIWGELEKALMTPVPSVFFEALDKMNALEIVFPEIHALKGRIQPEKHHPEGDAYVHTLEVIDRARDLGADDETMFAALVHDLGKAVTDTDNLPHHFNHEALGVPLVHAMCDRLRIPNTHRKVAAVMAKEHLNIHRFEDLRAVKKVRLLVRLGVIQSDLLARRVALASKADARGRGPLHVNAEYPQMDRVIEAAALVRQVKGNDFAHLKDGKKIAQNMERARCKALKDAGFK